MLQSYCWEIEGQLWVMTDSPLLNVVSQSLPCRPDVPHPAVPNAYMFAGLQGGGGVYLKMVT